MKKITLFLLVGFLFVGCASLQHLQNFAKCKFEFEKVEKVRLGTVDIQGKNSFKKMGLLEMGKIAKALISKELALEMDAVVKIKNPNAQMAALNRTDWILIIDNVEVTRGTTNQRIEIPANGSSYLPLHTAFNLFEVFSGDSKKAMFNLAENIAGVGDTPTNLQLKVKPTLSVAGAQIPYPGWITLDRKIGGNR